MKIAILYNDNKIYVEFETEQFKTLLKEMLKQTNGDIDKAFEQIIKLLKHKTLIK